MSKNCLDCLYFRFRRVIRLPFGYHHIYPECLYSYFEKQTNPKEIKGVDVMNEIPKWCPFKEAQDDQH